MKWNFSCLTTLRASVYLQTDDHLFPLRHCIVFFFRLTEGSDVSVEQAAASVVAAAAATTTTTAVYLYILSYPIAFISLMDFLLSLSSFS